MMQAIRDVVIEIVGRPIEVELVLWEELRQSGTTTPPARPAGASHLLDEALKQGARPADGASRG